jgi:hypothetical protein
MLWKIYAPRRGTILLAIILIGTVAVTRAEDMITREYWLKSADAATIIHAINIVIRNPTGKRIMGGQGKHLVITDAAEQQGQITEILPIIDKPSTETKPQRIVMEMVGRAGIYMHNNQKSSVLARTNEAPKGASAPASVFTSGINSYDTFKSTRSIYAEEDARILKGPRHILEEAVLPSFSDIVLKGILEPTKGKRIALLAAGGMLYTARDGGLFESNRSRLKGITSQVFADQVLLIGPDRVPRKFKFRSTL